MVVDASGCYTGFKYLVVADKFSFGDEAVWYDSLMHKTLTYI